MGRSTTGGAARGRRGVYAVAFGTPPPEEKMRAPRAKRAARRSRGLDPCFVAEDSHRPHGSYAKYVVELCRCPRCREANCAYERRRQRAMRRPDEVWMPYVPAGPARRHLRELAAAGIGPKSVAAISGVSHGTISKLLYGNHRGRRPSRRIRAETASKLLAVTPEMATGAQKVDAASTWALLNDLIERGWTRVELAHRLGQKGQGLQVGKGKVRASTARKVERLHQELIRVAAPPRRTRWSS